MKRVLVLMGVLLLVCAMTATAQAPARQAQSFTAENFIVSLNGRAVTIPLSASVIGDATDDGYRLGLELKNPEGEIARGELLFRDDALLLSADGAENDYAITLSDINELFLGSGVGETLQAMGDLFATYKDCYGQIYTPETQRRSIQLLLDNCGAIAGTTQTRSIFDQQVECTSYVFTVDAAKMDAYMRTVTETVPGYDAAVRSYIRMCQAMPDNALANVTADTLYSSLLEEYGLEWNMDCVFWLNEDRSMGEEEIVVRMTAPATDAEDAPETIVFPVSAQFQYQDTIRESASGSMTFETGDGEVVMDIQADTDLNQATNEGAMRIRMGVRDAHTTFAVDAQAQTKDDATDGSFWMNLEMDEPGAFQFGLSFDVTGQPVEMVDPVQTKNVVRLLNMDNAQRTQALEDLTTIRFAVMGGVMRTQGVGKLAGMIESYSYDAFMAASEDYEEEYETDEPMIDAETEPEREANRAEIKPWVRDEHKGELPGIRMQPKQRRQSMPEDDPAAGEPIGTLNAITIRNFSLDINEEEPIMLPLALTVGVGGEDETGATLLELRLAGDAGDIARGKVYVKDEDIRLGMDGVRDVYAISVEELKQAMLNGLESDMDEAQKRELLDMFFSMPAAYADVFAQADNITMTADSVQLMLDACDAVAGEPETVTVLGEEHTLTPYTFTMTGKAFDAYMNGFMEISPAFETVWESYLELMSRVPGSGLEDMDMDNLYASLEENMDIMMRMDVVLWCDESYSLGRMEGNMRMTSPAADGAPSTEELPFVTEYAYTDGSVRETMTIGVTDAQNDMQIEMKADIEFAPEKYYLDLRAEAETLAQARQLFTMGFGVAGANPGTGEGWIRVHVDPEVTRQTPFDFRFDMEIERARTALTRAMVADMDGENVVRLWDMDEAQWARTEQEIMRAVSAIAGGVMKVQGVPKLAGGLGSLLPAQTQCPTDQTVTEVITGTDEESQIEPDIEPEIEMETEPETDTDLAA